MRRARRDLQLCDSGAVTAGRHRVAAGGKGHGVLVTDKCPGHGSSKMIFTFQTLLEKSAAAGCDETIEILRREQDQRGNPRPIHVQNPSPRTPSFLLPPKNELHTFQARDNGQVVNIVIIQGEKIFRILSTISSSANTFRHFRIPLNSPSAPHGRPQHLHGFDQLQRLLLGRIEAEERFGAITNYSRVNKTALLNFLDRSRYVHQRILRAPFVVSERNSLRPCTKY